MAENFLGQRIEQTAQIAYEVGLRSFPIQFFQVPAHTIYEIAAYGLPARFSHWSFGGQYHKQKTLYDYGHSKIYELVINTDPAAAFLLENNPLVANTLVAAHVQAHVDFLANNPAFSPTNRKMIETARLAAERIDTYRLELGEREVEGFLDAALTVEMNFDHYDFKRPSHDRYLLMNRQAFEAAQEQSGRRRVSEFDDLWELGEKKAEIPKASAPVPFREEPDLLWFIANFSPILDDWQKDCLGIIRAEGQYFLPQMQTKTMNEGWATFWHPRIMRIMGERGYITDTETLEWAKMHAGVVAPSGGRQLNPYQIGSAIWEDIDRRSKSIPRVGGKKVSTWYGKTMDEPFLDEDVFAVRGSVGSDQAFLRSYLTPNLIEHLELYTYVQQGDEWIIEERDPEKVKARLLEGFVNLGLPVITVDRGGGDYNGNRELYLRHHRETHDLDFKYAEHVLRAIHQMWGRPVHLETFAEDRRTLLSCADGKTIQQTTLV